MLSPIRQRKSAPASASPSTRRGYSVAPAVEPRRAPLYQGSFHSPYAIAHRLTGEWRNWRALLEHNDVDEPWMLTGGRIELHIHNIDEGPTGDWDPAHDSMLEQSLSAPQPHHLNFPKRIRLSGQAYEDNFSGITLWAYDAAAPEPNVSDGITFEASDVESFPTGALTLAPVPFVLNIDPCFIIALMLGVTVDVDVIRSPKRTHLTSLV